MLGKLLKYEMRATARVFLPTYLLLLVFALLSRFSMAMIDFDVVQTNDFLTVILMSVIAVYVFTILGAFIVTFIVLIQRFYKNLTGDEGYLMFTLPVRTWELVASKALSALLWQIATTAAVVFSLFVLLFRPSYLPDIMNGLRIFWAEFTSEFGTGINIAAFMVEFLFAALIGAVEGMLMIYAAISIGHTIQNHRILGAVGAYIGLSVAVQMVSSAVMIPFGLINVNRIEFYVTQNPFAILHGAMLAGLLLATVCGVIFFFITTYIMGHQLNLE